jgi:hypothetical protein
VELTHEAGLQVSRPERAAALQRVWMERIAHPVAPLFVAGNPRLKKPSSSLIGQALPPNLHLITLDRIESDAFLLRIGHLYEVDEHPQLSRPATISLSSLFTCISDAQELNLAGNQLLSDMKRRSWNEAKSPTMKGGEATGENRFKVTLMPMQIRTWKIELDERTCDDAQLRKEKDTVRIATS